MGEQIYKWDAPLTYPAMRHSSVHSVMLNKMYLSFAHVTRWIDTAAGLLVFLGCPLPWYRTWRNSPSQEHIGLTAENVLGAYKSPPRLLRLLLRTGTLLPIAPNKPVVKSRENQVISVLSPEDSSTCHKTLDKQWKLAERLEEEMDGKHAPLTFNLISLLVGFSQDLLRQQEVCLFP